MHNIPTADAVMRSALETHTRSLCEKLTTSQLTAFHKYFPRGIDNQPLDTLKHAHALVRRTILAEGCENDERID